MRLALLTLLTMIAFAANSVLNRLGVAGGQIGAAEFAAVRLLSGAGMLLALVGLRAALRGTAIWPGGRGRLVGPLSLLVYLFGFSWAYRSLPAGAGALILFGTVQITMFAGALLGREAVPGARWAGAGLAFSGLCLLLVPGGGEVSLPHAAAMALAGAGWGVFSLSGRGQTDALGATAWNFGLALPLGLALALAAPTEIMTTPTGLSLAVLSGAVSSGLGYALWYRILPGLGASRAAVAQLTVPVLAALGGSLLLHEALTLRFAVAAALVLGGVGLAVLARR
jgi:drug/metabolite transporter (DMT)-like permease